MIARGFFSEMAKLAGAVPDMRHIQLMKDPASSGFVRPVANLRIAGGARNVGVTRPPIPSGVRAAAEAARVRAAVSRKTPSLPARFV